MSGELDELRQPAAARHVGEQRATRRGTGDREAVGEPGFWGGVSEADARAGWALAAVQDLIGPDGVVTPRLQGGRGPAQRARFVTWNAREGHGDATLGAPWPGQIPAPAPAVVHPAPLPAELVDPDGEPVSVSGRGLLTSHPGRLSVEKRPWSEVTAWAGPWPSDERWWSRSRRRRARLQAVTGTRPICWWPKGAVGGSKPRTNDRRTDMAYAELHAHSNFSFLDGASHPEELAAEASRVGLSALALTDHNGLYGVVRFAEAARAFGLPTVFGAELTVTGAGGPQAPHRHARPGRHPPRRAGPGPRGLCPTQPGHRRGPPRRRGEGEADHHPRRTVRAPWRPLAHPHRVP